MSTGSGGLDTDIALIFSTGLSKLYVGSGPFFTSQVLTILGCCFSMLNIISNILFLLIFLTDFIDKYL